MSAGLISYCRSQLMRFGPQMGQRSPTAIARGAIGAGLSLFLCTIALQALPHARETGLYLVSGFGAMSVLLFVLPNSPLAQPFSVIVGMIVSPLTAMVVLQIVPPPFADGLAVAAAIAVMLALRALHPPAAGLALLVVLQYENGAPFGFGFVLVPIAVVTVAMVVMAIVWNRLFGIPYPAPAVLPPETPSAAPEREHTAPPVLSENDITALLRERRLSSNVVAADVTGLVQSAVGRAQKLLLHRTPVSQIMTPAPQTISADTTLPVAAHALAAHHIKSLPVVDPTGQFMGLITQNGVLTALARQVTGSAQSQPPLPTAAAIMSQDITPVLPETSVAAIVERLHAPGAHAIPVVRNGQLLGMVSRTDLSALLISQLPSADPAQPL